MRKAILVFISIACVQFNLHGQCKPSSSYQSAGFPCQSYPSGELVTRFYTVTWPDSFFTKPILSANMVCQTHQPVCCLPLMNIVCPPSWGTPVATESGSWSVTYRDGKAPGSWENCTVCANKLVRQCSLGPTLTSTENHTCPPEDPPEGDDGDGAESGGESPILISLKGNRLELTDVSNGVNFDLNSDGEAERLSWTVAGSDDGFLALDRNGNGSIDDGTELFGNYTLQPPSGTPNGFYALAVFDAVEDGGNSDGLISGNDAVFSDLVLWFDHNHDGFSQGNELVPLNETRITAISLDFRESERRDRYGNEFRYWSLVYLDRRTPGPKRKFAVDVFLVAAPGG